MPVKRLPTFEIIWRVTISYRVGAVNLIPFWNRYWGFRRCALDLTRGGPFAGLTCAMKMVAATIVTAIRPRDLDAAVMSHGLRAGTGTREEAVLRMVEMVCAIDRGDLDSARRFLEVAVAKGHLWEMVYPEACGVGDRE